MLTTYCGLMAVHLLRTHCCYCALITAWCSPYCLPLAACLVLFTTCRPPLAAYISLLPHHRLCRCHQRIHLPPLPTQPRVQLHTGTPPAQPYLPTPFAFHAVPSAARARAPTLTCSCLPTNSRRASPNWRSRSRHQLTGPSVERSPQ